MLTNLYLDPLNNDGGGSGSGESQSDGNGVITEPSKSSGSESTDSSATVSQTSTPSPSNARGKAGIQELPIPEHLKGTKVDLSDSDVVTAPTDATEDGEGFRVSEKFKKDAQQKKEDLDEVARLERSKKTEDKSKKDVVSDKEDKTKNDTAADTKLSDTSKKPDTTSTSNIKRDYSKFSKEDADILKNTPNAVFAHFEKRLPILYAQEEKTKELLKQLTEKGIPQSWREHPEAYTLHPEYKEIQSTYNKARFEYDTYRNILGAIERGEEYKPFLGYDKGRPVFGEVKKPTSEDKIDIMSDMNAAQQYANNSINRMQELQSGFTAMYNTDIQAAQDVADKLWPWWRDEKSPKQVQVKELINKLPVSFQNTPAALLAGLLYSSVIELQGKLKDAEAKIAVAAKTADIEQKLEPHTSGASAVAASVGKKGKYPVATFDLDGMTD